MYVSEFRLEDYPVREQDLLHTGRAAFDAALNTVNVGKFNLCTAARAAVSGPGTADVRRGQLT